MMRNLPVAGPKVASVQWPSTMRAKVMMDNFPMDAMPPFARDKFIADIKSGLESAKSVHKVAGTVTVGGIAWDGGYGIQSVEISTDGGKVWSAATLGEDIGRYAFRTFGFRVPPHARGKLTVMARAANKIGQSQTAELIANPAGYHHNVMHRVTLIVA